MFFGIKQYSFTIMIFRYFYNKLSQIYHSGFMAYTERGYNQIPVIEKDTLPNYILNDLSILKISLD